MTRDRVVGFPESSLLHSAWPHVSAIAATMPAGQSEKRVYIIGQQELERHDCEQ